MGRCQRCRSMTHHIAGMKFGRLTALEIVVGIHRYAGRAWACECECGKSTIAYARQLISGHKASCGCLKYEASVSNGKKQLEHGHSGQNSPTYRSWIAMRSRCNNKDDHNYVRYGGRGITVCNEWNSFEAFLRDMGERPKGTTLGRRDNDQGYSKVNCQWETPKQQARNRRSNRRIAWGNRAMTLAELVDLTGVSRASLKYQLKTGRFACRPPQ